MNWILPGTVLEVDGSRPEAADELFSSLFVTGGLVLSQVCQITGLEPYTGPELGEARVFNPTGEEKVQPPPSSAASSSSTC